MADGQVIIQIKGDSSDYDKAIKGLGQQTQSSLGNAVKGSFIGNLFANAFSAAAGTISNAMDGAISRVDTLNRFPKMMDQIGFSADDAKSAIDRMSSHIQGLPTTLDSIVSSTQRIVQKVGDVDKATDIVLAFNDALVAGGQSSQVQSAALEQYIQGISKGKFELEEWRSITTAMPGQIEQVAKSLLGASGDANALYEALKDGTISIDDFTNAFVNLDKQGLEGMGSFAEQAKTGASGIQTSMDNAAYAVVINVGKIIDAVNANGETEGAFNAIKGIINDWGGKVVDVVKWVKENFGTIAPIVATAAGSFAIFKTASNVAPVIKSATKAIGNYRAAIALLRDGEALLDVIQVAFTGNVSKGAQKVQTLTGKVKALSGTFTATSASGAGLAGVLGGLFIAAGVYTLKLYVDHMNKVKGATEGLATAEERAKAKVGDTNSVISEARDRMNALADSADKAAESGKSFGEIYGTGTTYWDSMTKGIDNVITSMSELASSQQATWEEYYTSTALLDGYLSIIDELADKQNLSAGEQAQLTAAVEGYNDITGSTVSVVDAVNGKLSESTDKLHENAEAWKDNAEKQARQKMLQEDIEAQIKATDEYNKQVAHKNSLEATGAQLTAQESAALAEATGAYNSATVAAQKQIDAMNGGQQSLLSYIGANQQWVDALNNNGVAIDGFNEYLNQLGFTQDDLAGKTQQDIGFMAQAYNMFTQSGISVDQMKASMDNFGVTQQDIANLTPSEVSKIVSAYQNGQVDIDGIMGMIKESTRSKLGSAGTEGGSAMASNLANQRGAVQGGGEVLADAAHDGSTSQNGNASTWGEDLARLFAEGIASGKSWVSSAAGALAEAAKSVIGHSVPKKGPLREGGKGEAIYGLHLAQNFAKGITQGSPAVYSAVRSLSDKASDLMQTSGFNVPLNASATLTGVSTVDILGDSFIAKLEAITSRLDAINSRLESIEEKLDKDTVIKLNGREFGRFAREYM